MKGYDSMPKAKKVKNIPVKNYYMVIFIIIAVILATLYIFKMYEVKKAEKYQESYLITSETVSLEINDLNEINQVFMEAPETYFVYIGYTKDENVYNFEKELKPIIEEYGLKDVFYYIDATNLKEEDNYLDKLNDSLNLKEDKLDKIPAIIYFNNDTYEIVKRDDDNMIKAADLGKLLDINNIEKISQ